MCSVKEHLLSALNLLLVSSDDPFPSVVGEGEASQIETNPLPQENCSKQGGACPAIHVDLNHG